jgi:protein phosphatase 1 regulatory subunit 7
MNSINPSGSRICLDKGDSVSDVLKLVDSQPLKVLQFSKPLPQRLLESLNEEFFPRRPDVELRVYGFYGGVCDLSFCSRMLNVRKFRADCLQNATGVEHIPKMQQLESLGLGIYDLDSFKVLEEVNPGVTELFLLETKSKKPDLAAIVGFHSLKRLCLVGQQKNIDVLSSLRTLEDLTLGSITVQSLHMVRALPELSFLRITLGGTNNLSELQNMRTLKYLELWKILGLEDINFISTLTGLQSLFLQELTRITKLPSFNELVNLRRIVLDGLKNLIDISALAGAPSLSELSHLSSKLPIDDYLPLLKTGNLKYANVGFGNIKKNEHLKLLCQENSIVCGVNREFTIQ